MPYLPIHHTFGPHADACTVRAALSLLIRPWQWRNGPEHEQLRLHLGRSFGGTCALFGSGREGLLALFRALDLPGGSEIIVQGFTCVAVPNAIRAAGLTPVYADIEQDSLNLTVNTVRSVITPHTKAVLCQHTFGIPADTEALSALCTQHGLLLIEDCAHILPDVTGPKSLGVCADMLMLSFGRDKAASGVAGGAIISKRDTVSRTLLQAEQSAVDLSYVTVLRLLLYPSSYFAARIVYALGLGKLALVLLQKLRVLLPVLTAQEKRGTQCPRLTRMPNACAALALRELKKMHTVNNHRRLIAGMYLRACEENGYMFPSDISPDLPLQKFPILVADADRIRGVLKKHNIHLEDGWTGAAVCPRTCDAGAAGYVPGSCPVAERIAKEILSLPTHPTMRASQAENLMTILRSALS